MTEATTIPSREEIAPEHRWNAESVFASTAEWQETYDRTLQDIEKASEYQGHLADGPDVLLAFFKHMEAIFQAVGKIYVYAYMSYSVDSTDQEAAALVGKGQALLGRGVASVAFADPEILAIGREMLEQWMQDEPELRTYEHYFDDLFRKQQHVRSAEVEEVLGLSADPFRTVRTTAEALADADLTFRPAQTSSGEEVEVGQGNITHLLSSPDRTLRRTAWESYADSYLAFKNTFASNLAVAMKGDVLRARVRRYNSSLEAALFEDNIPTEVFFNLIDTFQKNLPTWHRYWAVRRKALGVDELQPYDVWAPLTGSEPEVPYDQAVEWICAGLEPMGEEYLATLRAGCYEDRWIDIYPNRGKRQGAFSFGWQGTHPFIVMSYGNNFRSMSTLAHELGHSMHSYYTWKTQPSVYAQYTIFLAEVASNFHQAMVRRYLLDHLEDPAARIAVIEEAMSNFHRYFFIMPTLARWELEMHERLARGEALTASTMNSRMMELFATGSGDQMTYDPERVGITWAQFTHMYMNFYVFQYATGISGAHALAKRIQEGEEGAVEAYINFLKAGSSAYSLDILKRAGVDLTTPEPVEAAFEVLASYVDELEALTS